MSIRRNVQFVLVFWVVATSCYALNREAFTFTSYDLKVRLDPATQGFAAEGMLRVRNDSEAPEKNITLQISGSLRWTSVRVGDTEVPWVQQTYTSDIDHTGELSEAILTLPEPVAPGGVVTINFTYAGTIPANTGRLLRMNTPGIVATRTDWDQISDSFTAVRGLGYVCWYPVSLTAVNIANGNALADAVAEWNQRELSSQMRVTFSVPEGKRLISNGDSVLSKGNETEVQFRSLGKYTPIFVVGAFEVLDRPNVTVYHLAEDTQYARDIALSVENTIGQMTDYFGPQKTKVIVVDLADKNAAPFEDGGPMLLTPLVNEEVVPRDMRMAHQIVHTIVSSRREWISEGLAYLGQLLVLEQRAGRETMLKFLGQLRLPLAETEAAVGPSDKGQPLVTTHDQIYYRTKAPFVWLMLHDMVGDQTLSKAIKNYREEQDTQPAYVQSLIEAQTSPKRDLEQFFDDWVYRDRGLPDFTIASVYPRPTLAKIYIVTVTVENHGNAMALVPVLVEAAGGGTRSERVSVPAKGSAVVRVSFPGTPEKVRVNNGSVPESNVDNNEFIIKNLPPTGGL